MKYFIITGTSRGLGKALVKGLLEKNHRVFCIARNEDRELMELRDAQSGEIEFFSFDLEDGKGIQPLMEKIFTRIDLEQAEGVYLVNNAGVLAPVKPLEDCDAEEILNNLQVNLAAPMILTAQFIKRTKNFRGEKKVVNISSGAGRKPHYGWSNYCAAKAGVNHFTRVVGVEQEERLHPVKIISLAPAIMDTEMQREIRSADKKDFQELDKFKGYKKEGKLLNPETVAEKVKFILLNENFDQGEIRDVREML